MRELVSFANPVWYEIEEEEGEKPSLEIRKADDTRTGISFYGVPGGHEINSFLSALYNTAGPGKEISGELTEKIRGLPDCDLKILKDKPVRKNPSYIQCNSFAFGGQTSSVIIGVKP